jgi:nicotinamide riboside kinase
MALRGCTVVAVEGTQTSGKTTLAHALVAHLRERGIHAAYADEPARSSPLVEEVMTGLLTGFDLMCEMDLFAAHITTQIRASRNHSVLVADKTILNAIAYCRHIFGHSAGHQERLVLDAMASLAYAWAHIYDLIFLCQESFVQRLESPAYKAPIFNFQEPVRGALLDVLNDCGSPLSRVPTGLTTAQRVEFVTGELRARGIVPAGQE